MHAARKRIYGFLVRRRQCPKRVTDMQQLHLSVTTSKILLFCLSPYLVYHEDIRTDHKIRIQHYRQTSTPATGNERQEQQQHRFAGQSKRRSYLSPSYHHHHPKIYHEANYLCSSYHVSTIRILEKMIRSQ
jgi:hypothetical protein